MTHLRVRREGGGAFVVSAVGRDLDPGAIREGQRLLLTGGQAQQWAGGPGNQFKRKTSVQMPVDSRGGMNS